MINFNNAKFLGSIGDLKQLKFSQIPEIVFSGKSNVGKSSLINKILNRKSLARVSNKPGKTININFYDLSNVRFVDLPGYGYARVSFSEKQRWSGLVEGYFNNSQNISLIVQIVDMRHPPTELDIQMLDYLYDRQFPFVIVTSKSDKLRKMARLERESQMEEEFKKYESIERIAFSAETGEGVDKLKSIISNYAGV